MHLLHEPTLSLHESCDALLVYIQKPQMTTKIIGMGYLPFTRLHEHLIFCKNHIFQESFKIFVIFNFLFF